MRRMLLVLWASALMVVLMGASALPAFAQVVFDPGQELELGGEGDAQLQSGAVFLIPGLLGGAALLRRNNRK